ncbi:hypothetical protein MD484_g1341, partial [Candolleomyces efflorescens]
MPYVLDHNGYNGLLTIQEADKALVDRQSWFKKIAPLLSPEGLRGRFNICLVHKHVVLQPGERMVATGLVTQPERVSDPIPSDIIPSSWTAAGIPFEWKRVSSSEEIVAPPSAEFFQEFSKIVGEDSILGVSLAQDPVPEGQVWCERIDHEARQHILEAQPVEGPWGDNDTVHQTSWALEPSTGKGESRLFLKIDGKVLLYGIATVISIIPESLVAVLTLTMAVDRENGEEHVIVLKLDALEKLFTRDNLADHLYSRCQRARMAPNPCPQRYPRRQLPDPVSIEWYSWATSPEGIAQTVRAFAPCDVASTSKAGGPEGIEEIPTDNGGTEEKKEKVRFEGVEEDTEAPKEERFNLKIEFPFSSDLKRMTTIYPERILDTSTEYVPPPEFEPKNSAPLTSETRASILHKYEQLASQCLRVIGLAHKAMSVSEVDWGSHPHCLSYRSGVEIISPDAPKSAVMTATVFDKMDKEIDELPELPLVTARCAPDTKVRMVHAGKRRAKHFSVDGDGVNDHPPSSLLLRVSRRVWLVAKGAANLVLTDEYLSTKRGSDSNVCLLSDLLPFDRLATLTPFVSPSANAVVSSSTSNDSFSTCSLLTGRRSWFSSSVCFQNAEQRSVFLLSPILNLVLTGSSFNTVQLTSAPPAFGLGLEKAAADSMRRPPHDVKNGVFLRPVMIALRMVLLWETRRLPIPSLWFTADMGRAYKHSTSDIHNVVFRGRFHYFCDDPVTVRFRIEVLLTASRPSGIDLIESKILFFAVVGGMISVAVPVYIPGQLAESGVFSPSSSSFGARF